jgi:hypothetical protein
VKRLRRAFPASCGLCLALFLLAGRASAATPICEFFSFMPADQSAKGVVGQKYPFRLTLTHPASDYFDGTVSVSATVDWGDGSVETSPPKTFGHGFGTPYFAGQVEHAYQRTGKFTVKILRGTVNGQACPLGQFKAWEAGFGAPTVTVIAGLAQAQVVHAVPSSGAAALAQKKAVFVPTPTPTPASVSATSRKAKVFVPTPTPIKTYSIPR